jgi:hypothetical protein
MKHLLTLLAVLFSLASFAQSNIYNPDSDDDGLITSEDLLIFLSNFGNDFTPSPCNCGCYANPFYEPYAVADTLSAYEVASNLFLGQPDSLRFDFVIAPYGTGWMPFNDADTIYYDTLTFSQTYPYNFVDLDGASTSSSGSGNYGSGYGNDVPYMQYRYPSVGCSYSNYSFAYRIDSYCVQGGLDIFDGYSDFYAMRVKANAICPNLQNDEYWTLQNAVNYFQVEEGVYVNVNEFASTDIPIHASAEYPTSWFMHYPLNWLVITEIFNDPAE